MAQQYIQYVNQLTVDELITLMKNILNPILEKKIVEIQEASKEESNLVNIKVVMEKLQVTKPTIYNWIKKEIIKPQKIGGKVLFDLPVILKSIKMYDYKLRRGGKDFNI